MKLTEYIQKCTTQMPSALAERNLSETSIWTNDACYGYCIIALKAAGYSADQIDAVLHFLHLAFEDYSVEDAEKKWIN